MLQQCETRISSVFTSWVRMPQRKFHKEREIQFKTHTIYFINSTRSFGSAALALCYVATGQCDAYHVDDLQPWDIAAGAVIITEAGGVIYHTEGGKFNVMKPDFVCAATEELCQKVISLIGEANQITEYTFK